MKEPGYVSIVISFVVGNRITLLNFWLIYEKYQKSKGKLKVVL